MVLTLMIIARAGPGPRAPHHPAPPGEHGQDHHSPPAAWWAAPTAPSSSSPGTRGNALRALHLHQPRLGPVRLGLLDMVTLQRDRRRSSSGSSGAHLARWLFVLSLLVNVGMWFERFVIIVTSLHRDFLPSSWAMLRADLDRGLHADRQLRPVLHAVPALRPGAAGHLHRRGEERAGLRPPGRGACPRRTARRRRTTAAAGGRVMGQLSATFDDERVAACRDQPPRGAPASPSTTPSRPTRCTGWRRPWAAPLAPDLGLLRRRRYRRPPAPSAFRIWTSAVSWR